MADVDGSITNNDNSYKFQFRCMAPIRNSKSQAPLAIPFINTKPENQPHFRFQGPKEELSFTFALFNDDVDVADGTYSAVVKTIQEQVEYLRDEVFGEDYDVDWTFIQATFYPSPGINCLITDLEIENPPAGVNQITGRMTLKLGTIGSI